MATGKNRNRIPIKGGGNLDYREKSPSAATVFSNLGYIRGTTLQDEHTVEDLTPETGTLVNSMTREQKRGGTSSLMQKGRDELVFLMDAADKLYALRYHGKPGPSLWQYILWDNARIKGGFENQLQSGHQPIPIAWRGYKDDTLAYDLPEVLIAEADNEIHVSGLNLWVDPRFGYNAATAYALDLSGFQRVGTISSDFVNIWLTGTPARFLRFDGVVDEVSWGNVLNLDAANDFAIEFWARIQGANGSTQEILSKKAGTATGNPGYMIVRNTSNEVRLTITDGTDEVVVGPSGTLLQNVWGHFMFTGDRDGNVVGYVNGVAGTPQSMTAVGDMTNASNLYLARVASSFGQVDIGAFRVYIFGAGGLPTNIATIAARHFAAERSYYGV